MITKTLIQVGAIILMLFFTGCNRTHNDSSQNNQPLTAATSVSASNEAAPTQATAPTDVIQTSDDLNQDLDSAINDLDTTDGLNDLP